LRDVRRGCSLADARVTGAEHRPVKGTPRASAGRAIRHELIDGSPQNDELTVTRRGCGVVNPTRLPRVIDVHGIGLFHLGWQRELSLERLGTVLLAMGYGGVIIWASDKPRPRSLLAWAAPLGRMAFTNYVLQPWSLVVVLWLWPRPVWQRWRGNGAGDRHGCLRRAGRSQCTLVASVSLRAIGMAVAQRNV
jgi:Protein of unknown function (DUF418)